MSDTHLIHQVLQDVGYWACQGCALSISDSSFFTPPIRANAQMNNYYRGYFQHAPRCICCSGLIKLELHYSFPRFQWIENATFSALKKEYDILNTLFSYHQAFRVHNFRKGYVQYLSRGSRATLFDPFVNTIVIET